MLMSKEEILSQIKEKELKFNQLKSKIEDKESDEFHKSYNDLLNYVALNLWNPDFKIIDIYLKEKEFAEKNLIKFSELSDDLKSDINLICLALCIDTEKNFYQIPEAIREKAITDLIIGIDKYGYTRDWRYDPLEKEYILKHTILSKYFDTDVPLGNIEKSSIGDWYDNSILASLLNLFVENTPFFDSLEHKKYIFILFKEFGINPESFLENAFQQLDQSLLDDENFILEVLSYYNNYGIPIQYAGERLRKDKSLALRVCSIDGSNLLDFDLKFLKDREVVITALLNSPIYYRDIDPDLQQDDLIYDLVIKHPHLNEHELKGIKKIKAEASS